METPDWKKRFKESLLSIGFDDDEDDRYEDPPFCPICQNELCTDLFGGWFCEVCSELEEDKE